MSTLIPVSDTILLENVLNVLKNFLLMISVVLLTDDKQCLFFNAFQNVYYLSVLWFNVQ